MRKTIALFALLISGTAPAQTPSVLLEACNTLQDAEKRLECLKAAIGSSPNVAAANTGAVDTLERAFGALQAGIDVGMSYRDYQTSVLDLAKSLAAFKQQMPNIPTALFDEALGAYSDAGMFWLRSIEFYSRRGNDLAYSGGLPVSMNGLDWLVPKYGLATVKSDIWGIERGLPVQPTTSQIWAIAKTKADGGIKRARVPSTPKASTASIDSSDPEVQAVKSIIASQQCRDATSIERTKSTESQTKYSTICGDGRALIVECATGSCKVLQ